MRLRFLFLSTAVLATAVPAFAGPVPPVPLHGGQYRGPGGRSPGDPSAPVRSVSSATTWESWWAANAWEYLDLRRRLRRRDEKGTNSTGGIGQTAGSGEGNETAAAVAENRRRVIEQEILPVVLAALDDADAEVRSAATVALGKMGFPRAMPALRKARRDSVRDVRDGAVLALGMLQEPLLAEELATILFDPAEDARTRSFAGIALGLAGGPEAARLLLDFLAPEADEARMGGIRRTAYTESAALVALGLAGDRSVAAAVRGDYASGTRFEPAVRSFAALTLSRLGDRESLPFLLQGLAHQREPMRQSAAIALAELATEDDVAVLDALFEAARQDGDMNTRQFAIMGLAQIPGEAPKVRLRALFEKAVRSDLAFVALGLGVAGDRASLPMLRKGFADARNPDVMGAMALSLGLLGDLESAETLRRIALHPGNAVVRGHCLTALGLMGDAASAEAVRKWLPEEREPGLRAAGALCLGLLSDPAALPVLKGLATEGDTVSERSMACRILGAVGDLDGARILIGFVQNQKDNSVVRMTAVAALGSLADRNDIPLLARVARNGNYAVFVDPLQEIGTIM